MNLTLIGAGGFRTPLMYEALARSAETLGLEELTLYDVDAQRLARIESVIEALAEAEGVTLRCRTASTLDDALDGADFIFCAIRVGGIEARVIDELVPLGEGVVGQETTGPGGIAFALRTVPVMREIAERVAERAPNAWFINFTNPAGLVTEALRPILGDRVVGICDGPPVLFNGLARVLDVPRDEVFFDYFGLNHLAWVKGVYHRSGDLLPGLLEDDARLAGLEEAALFTPEWLRSLEMIPNAYLYYYYAGPQAVAGMTAAGETRAQHILASQSRFYADGDHSLPEILRVWREVLHDRETTYMSEASRSSDESREHHATDAAGGYAGVAIRAMSALLQNKPALMVLNTANRQSLPFLDTGAVVEVPCLVNSTGVHPLAVGDVPLHARGLIEILKEVEWTAIEAAVTGSTRLAIRALALHPLVPSRDVAERIFHGYREQHTSLKERFAA